MTDSRQRIARRRQQLQLALGDALDRAGAIYDHAGVLADNLRDSRALLTLIALSSPFARRLSASTLQRIPGIRRLPVMQLLLAGQVLLLAREHLAHLTAQDRHRLLELAQSSHGDPRQLSPADRAELSTMLAKIEPKLFLSKAAMSLIRGRRVSR